MKKAFAILGTIILIGIIIIILLKDVIYRKYKNSDFGINTYISKYDKDNDGIDDQTDILNNVKNIFHKGQNIKVSIMKQAILMINMVFVRMLLDMD